MMETEKLNSLYELTRTYLIHSEAIEQGINELKNKRLKEHLIEMLHTCQADILIINDFLFEASTCEDETDLNYLINCAAEDDSFSDETTFPVN